MRGLGIILYGPEGIGKTSLGAQFPKPMTFLSLKEHGYEELLEADLMEEEGIEHFDVTSYPSLLSHLKEAKGQKTVVVDSLSGFQQLLFEWCIEEFYEGSVQKFNAYSEGPSRTAPQQMVEFMALLSNLNSSGTNVILLAHSRVETVRNSLGADYSQAVIDLNDRICSVFTKWARAILFINLDLTIKKDKADDTQSRMIYTEKAPGHMAKNRMNLRPYITCGESPKEAYDNFVKALPPKIKENLNG